MNNGSNKQLRIAPLTIDIIEYFGEPSALITEFKTVLIIENGNPNAIHLP